MTIKLGFLAAALLIFHCSSEGWISDSPDARRLLLEVAQQFVLSEGVLYVSIFLLPSSLGLFLWFILCAVDCSTIHT